MNKVICDGECNKHNECFGSVKPVIVSGNGWKNPFHFNYCEVAIEVDKSRGFTVELKEEEEH